MKDIITGQKKYENYREQFKRLNRALANNYNLEALFIEYAIIEDRTESILQHAGRWDLYLKRRKNHGPTLDSKIKYILKCTNSKISMLDHYYADGLLEDILSWKEERNRLIHALLKQELAHNEISQLAVSGNELVKKLRNRTRSYNRKIINNVAIEE